MANGARPTRVLSWWLVVLLVLVVVGVGVGYVYLVGFVLGAGDPRAQVISDALGPALLVVVTLALLVALVVAARAQWLRERVQRYRELNDSEQREHAERVQAHEERVSAVQQREQEQVTRSREERDAEHATADALMRAIEQMGNEHPAVRMGALAVLERLGQQHPEQRQPVADVVCGYLRLPASASPTDRAVRQSAQRLLLRHADPSDRRAQWRGVRMDLAGAELADFEASGCALSSVDFSGAIFGGVTSFADCVLDGSVRMAGARFGPVSFHGAKLASGAFERVAFTGPAEFDLAEFTGAVAFERAVFDVDASFAGTRFGETVMFSDVDFAGGTSFQQTAFGGDVAFMRTTFRGTVTFAEATLGGHSWFEDVWATTAYAHGFPPGYREAPVDDAWVLVQYAPTASGPGENSASGAAGQDAVGGSAASGSPAAAPSVDDPEGAGEPAETERSARA